MAHLKSNAGQGGTRAGHAQMSRFARPGHGGGTGGTSFGGFPPLGGTPKCPAVPSGETWRRSVAELAAKVERLAAPGHRDPERFWRDKSALADELRSIAHG